MGGAARRRGGEGRLRPGGAGLAGLGAALLGCGAGDAFGELGESEVRSAALRKRTPVLSLAAGAPGGMGYADRAGVAVRLGAVQDLALGPDGSIYFADSIWSEGPSYQHTVVRRLGPDGSLATLLGRRRTALRGQCGARAEEAEVFQVSSLAVSPGGALYIVEPAAAEGGSILRRVEPSGEVTLLFGSLPPCTGPYEASPGLWGPALPSFDAYAKLAPSGELIVFHGGSGSAPGRLLRIGEDGASSTLVDEIGFPNTSGQQPSRFAIAADGTIFFADAGRHAVFVVSAEGEVSLLAGAVGQRGDVDGMGASARFDQPSSIAVHPSGDVYVADVSGSIRRITPAGVVTSVPAPPSGEPFGSPRLLVDGAGRLLVSHRQGSTFDRLDAVSLEGEREPVLAGLPESPGNADGWRRDARFHQPRGMDADGRGNVYIADGNDIIRKLSRRGEVTTVAGTEYPRVPGEPSHVDGPAHVARFRSIEDVAVDRESGVLYVADGGNDSVRRIGTDGVVSTIARVESGPPPTLGSVAVAPGGDVLFVGSPYEGVVWRWSPSGELRQYALVSQALSVTAAPDGTVFVASGDIEWLYEPAFKLFAISPEGEPRELAPLSGLPGDMTVDGDGRLYIVQRRFDPGWTTVSRLSPDGTLEPVLNDGVYAGVALGPLERAGVNFAWGLAASGRALYVSDVREHSILKLHPLPR